MKIDMPYGKTSMNLTLPAKLDYTVLDDTVHGEYYSDHFVTDNMTDRTNEKELIEKALKEAVSTNKSRRAVPFDLFFKTGKTVAVIVSDYTRATGSEVYIPIIISRLEILGIKSKDITIVIALGLHRPSTEKEIVKLLTEEVYKKVRVINHDPNSGLKRIGKTKINRVVAEASRVVITGSVTFHPMAGFSGGYKSIIPGIASTKDILANHKLYFKGLEPNLLIEPGRVDGNPLLNDIIKRSGELKNTYCLNVVLNGEKEIVFAASGDVLPSWKACCEFLNKNYTVTIGRKYPLVIASAGGYPADFSFYQSMKALTNSARACYENGMLVILSQCSNGWEISSEYLKLFQMSLSELVERLFDDFNMEKMAVLMALKIIKKYRIYFLSSLPENEIAKIGLIPLENRNALIRLISQVNTENAAVIRRASSILPLIGEV